MLSTKFNLLGHGAVKLRLFLILLDDGDIAVRWKVLPHQMGLFRHLLISIAIKVVRVIELVGCLLIPQLVT
jgi:hypothetical protein